MGDHTVIVVDDDDGLLNALTFGIEAEGYRVLPFSSAAEMLNLRELPKAECMVVDHRLPRLDGLYLIELMRARGLSAPAILMTSHPGRTLRLCWGYAEATVAAAPVGDGVEVTSGDCAAGLRSG